MTNAGDRTAAAVALSLVVRDGGAVVESRGVTLDYVPPNARVTGGLYLRKRRRTSISSWCSIGYAADP